MQGLLVMSPLIDTIKLIQWLNQKDIFLNKEKTVTIFFESQLSLRFRDNLSIKLHENKCIDENKILSCNCKDVENKKNIKYIGLQFNNHLKWNNHTIYLKNKLNNILHKMQYLKKIMPLNIKCMMYKTLCESILKYEIETYEYTAEVNLKPVKTVQKKILKATLYPRTSKIETNRIMIDYRILNFTNLHKYNILITNNYYKEVPIQRS